MSTIGPGRPVKSQTQEVIFNVKSYFAQEKLLGHTALPLAQVLQRTAKATAVGIGKVKAICAEGDAAKASGAAFPTGTPGKKRPRLSPVLKPDSFSLEAIRRRVHDFYLKGTVPTLRQLHRSFHDENVDANCPAVFQGSKESLRIVLTKELGFQYKKVDRRKHLLERTDVIAWRHTYLRQMKDIDLKKVIFLDETWVNEHHTVGYCWQSENCFGVEAPTGKGKRLILLHAGTADGFLPNCMLLFVSNSGLADYHEDMNAEVFTDWFVNQLITNIPPKSTIVMDNAPYHSVLYEKAPTSNSRKKDMQEWLSSKQIPYSEDMLRPELYEVIKLHKPRHKKYVIDEIAADKGHRIVRLPPYHCQFNPIELIWAQVKNTVAKENSTFKLADVTELTKSAISKVTAENWKKAVIHVQKVMDDYNVKDPIIDNVLEPIVISVSGRDSDTDTASEDSDESLDSFVNSFKRID